MFDAFDITLAASWALTDYKLTPPYSCVALTTLTLNPENIGRWTGNDQVVGEPQRS